MLKVNIHEARTQLSKLVAQASQGEEIIIAKAGIPVARLIAITPSAPGRCFGALRGRAQVDDRFFEPLPEPELRAWE